MAEALSDKSLNATNKDDETPKSFKILGSSSAGNCGLIMSDTCKILVDVGFSGKRIRELLAANQLSIEEIDAVFITHEHSDHTCGIKSLYKYKHLNWVANRATYEAINFDKKSQCQWSIFETGSQFQFNNLNVEAFSIPHDAADPVGYNFSWGGEDLFTPYESITWLLDVGYVTNLIRDKLKSSRTLILEANYDNDLLEMDAKRPWSVKQRILGRHGHLSNQHASDLVHHLKDSQLREIIIAHVSKDCNSVEAIRSQFAFVKEQLGSHVAISIHNPHSERTELL